jgi:hypothetical protein
MSEKMGLGRGEKEQEGVFSCLLYVREKMVFLPIWYPLYTAMGRDWSLIAMLIY